MRICIDMDGTICKTRRTNQSYSDVEPMEGVREALKELKRQGHYIIICTARHMKTCDNNVGKVVARQGKTFLSWLDKYETGYDEIWFGKPYADVYIDDNVIPFRKNWASIVEEVQKHKSKFDNN